MDRSEAIKAFSALSQGTRLDALRLLVRAGGEGMLAGEISAALDARQNTMSTNLSILVRAGLISNRREGRMVRYQVDIDGVKGLLEYLLEDCCQGHVELCAPFAAVQQNDHAANFETKKSGYNILFLGETNSHLSLMAEALMQREGIGKFNAFSAGISPAAAPNDEAIALLQSNNFITDGLTPSSWDRFLGKGAPHMDFVVSISVDVPQEPPQPWPGQPVMTHWSLGDQAEFDSYEASNKIALGRAFARLRNRVTLFANLPMDSLDQLTLQQRLQDISSEKDT